MFQLYKKISRQPLLLLQNKRARGTKILLQAKTNKAEVQVIHIDYISNNAATDLKTYGKKYRISF